MYTHYQWFRDESEIPNETGARLEINDFGMNDVGVSHCVMTNDSLPLLTLRRSPVTLMLQGASGVGLAAIQELSFYPNPAGDLISVKNLDSGGIIQIFDITGRLQQQVTLGTDSEINISGLAPGQYCIEAVSGATRHIGRFVKH
jgi:hypothetical protein